MKVSGYLYPESGSAFRVKQIESNYLIFSLHSQMTQNSQTVFMSSCQQLALRWISIARRSVFVFYKEQEALSETGS